MHLNNFFIYGKKTIYLILIDQKVFMKNRLSTENHHNMSSSKGSAKAQIEGFLVSEFLRLLFYIGSLKLLICLIQNFFVRFLSNFSKFSMRDRVIHFQGLKKN